MLPSALMATGSSCPSRSGPCELNMKRFCCSGPRTGANALRAFSDSSRKPKLKPPRQLPMPGLVMISTRTMPAS